MSRNEPSTAGDERTLLLEYLSYHRETLLLKCEGLDASGLSARIPSSSLTLGGLLKHLAFVEDMWMHQVFLGTDNVEPWHSAPWEEDRDWEFTSAADHQPEELRELYRAAAARTDAIVATADLDQLSQRAHHGQPNCSLRWILIHLIEETARHNGHADLLREAFDGVTGE